MKDGIGGVGFLNVDMIYSGLARMPGTGEEIYAENFGMYPGGGLPATLVNTARLGIPSRILTFLGTDDFSAFAAEQFAKYPAELINLYRGSGRPVTVTSAMVYEGDRSFVSFRDELKGGDYDPEELFRELLGRKIVVMTTEFPELYARLKKNGTILVLDVGWSDDLCLEGYDVYLRLADYFVPNEKEALAMTGTDTPGAAAEVLAEYFPDVIVKLGGQGCLLRGPGGTEIILPRGNVKAVDTTGAGDAFLAGFLYGIYHGYPTADAVRFGNLTGTACVQKIGCLSGFLTEEELLREKRTY